MPSQHLLRLCSIVFALCVTACSDKPAAAPPLAAPEPPPSAPAPAAAEPAPSRPSEPPPLAAPTAVKDPAPSVPPAAPADPKLSAPGSEASAKHSAKAPKPPAQPVEKAAPPATAPAPLEEEAKASPATPAASGPCGEKGQPRCPLQAWMEDHLQSALDAKDLPALARGLTLAAKFAPDPSWNDGPQGWPTLTNSAADSAKQGDVAAVQAACKACHKAWRTKYKQAFRTRPVAD